MRIRAVVLSALLLAMAVPALAQQQPQIYPLDDSGQQGQQVDPRPTDQYSSTQPPRTVHHYPVYSQQQQPQYAPQEDDQEALTPPVTRRATRTASKAIQTRSIGHHLWQIVLVPRDESVSSEASIILVKLPGRDECEKRIIAFYDALGSEDDSQEPDYTLACQYVSE